MNKAIFTLLIVVAVVGTLLFGCAAPAPTPAPTPAPAPAPSPTPSPTPTPEKALRVSEIPEYETELRRWVDPDLLMNPFGEDFAVKPDGTPYYIAYNMNFLNHPWTAGADRIGLSLLERAGCDVLNYDPNMDIEKQIAFFEDCVAMHHPDAVIVLPINNTTLGPSVDMCAENNIPVFAYDLKPAPTENVTAFTDHDFLAESCGGGCGCDLVGKYYVDWAKEHDKKLYVYEVWMDFALEAGFPRHDGFVDGIENVPDGEQWVEIAAQGETLHSEDVGANLIMDAFTVDPKLNAIWCHGGGFSGSARGLEAIGCLKPIDDPDHVVIGAVSFDTAVLELMEEGLYTVAQNQGFWDEVDVLVKYIFLNVVLGQPVPEDTHIPMVTITLDNMHEIRTYGATPLFPYMPSDTREDYDKWPVLDTAELGVPTPTKEMRMEILGY